MNKSTKTFRYAQNLLGRLPADFKDSAVGRKICHEIIGEVAKKRRAVAVCTMSDMF